jgi:hypothetical protein
MRVSSPKFLLDFDLFGNFKRQVDGYEDSDCGRVKIQVHEVNVTQTQTSQLRHIEALHQGLKNIALSIT